jgi:hypothetical protein
MVSEGQSCHGCQGFSKAMTMGEARVRVGVGMGVMVGVGVRRGI